jgi:hypothetical protein
MMESFAWIDLPPSPAPATVFHDSIQFAEAEWHAIAESVRASAGFPDLADKFPGLKRQLDLPYEEVLNSPMRVYGGSTQYEVHLMHPLGFHVSEPPPDGNPELEWWYALLSETGGHIFMTWANVLSRPGRIEHQWCPSHFVEKEFSPPKLTAPE